MYKKLILALSLIITSAVHAESDLTIEGERWLADHTGYICNAFSSEVSKPIGHQDLEVEFKKLSTDYTLDNALLKGSFKVNGAVCSYSAILFADNAASTIKIVDSKAFSLTEGVDCAAGKKLLDQQLTFNQYLYWGHPHHVTIMFPSSSAAELCGEGSTHIGIDFILTGIIR